MQPKQQLVIGLADVLKRVGDLSPSPRPQIVYCPSFEVAQAADTVLNSIGVSCLAGEGPNGIAIMVGTRNDGFNWN